MGEVVWKAKVKKKEPYFGIRIGTFKLRLQTNEKVKNFKKGNTNYRMICPKTMCKHH